MDFSIQRQIQNAQKHGVCAITIYMTEKPSNNYECVGVKDQTTMQVILLNIILIFTIAKWYLTEFIQQAQLFVQFRIIFLESYYYARVCWTRSWGDIPR